MDACPPTRLLAVEDELPMLEVVCDALRRLPQADVVGTDSVGEALRHLELQPFDVLVTDLRLPRPGGLVLIERVRDQHPDLPVVVVTGYPTAENARRCRELGAAVYLRKPFDPQVLIAAVAAVLADQADRTT